MREPQFEPYTSLAPFHKVFRSGTPILMYHKLGPRPRGARLKGLYVGKALFLRQLIELRRAGFASASLGRIADSAAPAGPHVIITFDDGFANAMEFGLGPLAETNFKAIQFLVADRLGGCNEWDLPAGEVPERLMDGTQVREWLAGGHEIGSHTLTHPWLTRLAPARAREEIAASKKKLEDEFGRPVDHFCYPYGHWNPAVRDMVAGAGYRTACITEPGINTPGTDRYALKRFMARYASRNLKSIWNRVKTSIERT